MEKPDLDPTASEMEKITVTCQTSATKGVSTGPAENLFCVELYLDRFARFLVLRVNYSNQCFLSHSCPRRLRAQSINYWEEGFWEAAKGTQASPQLKNKSPFESKFMRPGTHSPFPMIMLAYMVVSHPHVGLLGL